MRVIFSVFEGTTLYDDIVCLLDLELRPLDVV